MFAGSTVWSWPQNVICMIYALVGQPVGTMFDSLQTYVSYAFQKLPNYKRWCQKYF